MPTLGIEAMSSDAITTFGKYHPLFELGRGGMATVMLTVIRGPAGFNKLQVLKILLDDLTQEEDFLTMFLEEARLSARLNHPNIVQTNEVGSENGKYFIAMEYLEGHSLEEIFRYDEAREGVPLPISLYVLLHSLAGLHYAHELKDFQDKALSVVHRDVSPQNIFVTYDGQVKVVDFGIAKAANSKIETRSGVIKGKVAYMAREQLGGEMPVDRRADLFAVGAVLWRVLAGQRLWRGVGDFEIFRRLINNEIPLPSSVKKGVDPELEAICMKALSFEPDDRYATAADFQTAIERYIEKTGARASTREVGEYVRTAFASRRGKIKAAIESRLNAASELGAESFMTVPPLATLVSSSNVGLQTTESFAGSISRTGSKVGPFDAKPHSPLVTLIAAGVAVVAVAMATTIYLASRVRNQAVVAAVTPTVVQPPTGEASPALNGAATDRNDGTATPSDVTTALTIRVTPRNARLKLDDVVLPSNPWSGSFARDSEAHHLRIEAPGYVTRVEDVAYNTGMIELNLSLEHATASAGVVRNGAHPATPADTSHVAPTAAPTPAAPTAPPASTKSTKPSLDKIDPWNN